MRRLSESKCCVLGHLWQQTIGPYAVLDPAEFISKMGIVVEEADETVFWLEILTETGVVCRQGRQLAKRSKRTICDFQCVTTNLEARLLMIQSPDDSLIQCS